MGHISRPARAARAARAVWLVRPVRLVRVARLACLILAISVIAVMDASPAVAIELGFPLGCKLGQTCFIQNYVDVDASPARRDFNCTVATYDGHKGVDFRLVSTASVSVKYRVLAAADGVVRGRRDGMADRLYNMTRARAIKGRECGNGLILDHGGGWQTQYCHMRKGSLRVKKGQRVKRGDYLGDVGYSGKAAFAHLHLTLRRNGRVIDPFSARPPSTQLNCPSNGTGTGAVAGAGAVAASTNKSVWSRNSKLRDHVPAAAIIERRFIGRILKPLNSENGLIRAAPPSAKSRVLLFAARLINLAAGDRLQLSLSGPGGIKAKSLTPPLPRSKASYGIFIGKKRRTNRWLKGLYSGRITILRQGRAVGSASARFTMK